MCCEQFRAKALCNMHRSDLQLGTWLGAAKSASSSNTLSPSPSHRTCNAPPPICAHTHVHTNIHILTCAHPQTYLWLSSLLSSKTGAWGQQWQGGMMSLTVWGSTEPGSTQGDLPHAPAAVQWRWRSGVPACSWTLYSPMYCYIVWPVIVRPSELRRTASSPETCASWDAAVPQSGCFISMEVKLSCLAQPEDNAHLKWNTFKLPRRHFALVNELEHKIVLSVLNISL